LAQCTYLAEALLELLPILPLKGEVPRSGVGVKNPAGLYWQKNQRFFTLAEASSKLHFGLTAMKKKLQGASLLAISNWLISTAFIC
jgi:hypothetical protein